MFGIDKLYHVSAGFAIGLVFGLINPLAGLLLSVAAGVGKEVYDMYIKKSFADPLDTITTVIGGIIGTALSIFLINLI